MNECELAKIKGKDGESWYKGKKIKQKVRNETQFPDRRLLASILPWKRMTAWGRRSPLGGGRRFLVLGLVVGLKGGGW
jgi:hypothetical protein